MVEFGAFAEAMEVDKLADALNDEISSLAFGLEPNYDWKVVQLIQSAAKQLFDHLDRTLALSPTTSILRAAFRKLDTRMHLG